MQTVLGIILVALAAAGIWWTTHLFAQTSAPTLGPGQVAVEISGGHETDPVDRGRPVRLIAAALGVTDEVFRDAFSGVSPAPAGERPTREREQQNKRVLLDVLGKHGVTNDRLDEVSDYYRYRPGGDMLWRHRSAKAVAQVNEGRVTAITVTDAGAGYTTPPKVVVPGHPNLPLTVTLAFGKDLKTNGGIGAITLAPATTQRTARP